MRLKIKKIYLLLFLPLFLSSCSTYRIAYIMRSGEGRLAAAGDVIVPFISEGHAIIVKVKLNDSERDYNFILDTGAFTIIDESIARELGLNDIAALPAGDVSGGANTIILSKIGNISIGGAVVNNSPVTVIDISKFEGYSGVRIDGILGSNLLRFFKIIIDYDNETVTFSKDTEPAKIIDNGYLIRFEPELAFGFAPMFDSMVNGKYFLKTIVDTGSGGFISISRRALEKLSEIENLTMIESKGALGGGLFSDSKKMYLSRLDSVQLGPIKIEDVPVDTIDLGVVIVGKEFLSRFLVSINYPAGEMILIPFDNIQFENNIFSAGLNLMPDEYDETIVGGFWENSPADRIGLEIGDRILSVNSINIDDISILNINNILQNNEVKSIDLVISNENGINEFTLDKETLLPDIE